MRKHNERSEATGRYVPSEPCEACGKPAGANYQSLATCNADGIGVVLCKRHGAQSDEEIRRLINVRQKLQSARIIR